MLNVTLAFGLSDIHPAEALLIGLIFLLMCLHGMMNESVRELQKALDQFWNMWR